jgi:hypothetical protein
MTTANTQAERAYEAQLPEDLLLDEDDYDDSWEESPDIFNNERN